MVRVHPFVVGWALALFAGCGDGGTRGPDIDPEAPKIGLRRGAAWSVLSLQPPHLHGPQFSLVLRNSVLSGAMTGGESPSGNIRVRIDRESVSGFGPVGVVEMQLIEKDDGIVADGMWNGGRVHMVFTGDAIKGTVASNSSFEAKSDAIGLFGMATFQNRRPHQADVVDPLPADQSCEYYLTTRSADGALNGGSICSGMPQETRLEVPMIAQAWFTRGELVTVLVAMMAAPPSVTADRFGPRFENARSVDSSRENIRTMR